MKYDRSLDRLVGHVGIGISKNWPAYELDEIMWWEIHREEVEEACR